MIKNFYFLWLFVGLMYLAAVLAMLGALAIIAADDYPELIQVLILVVGFSSAFVCACWGDYVRLQLAIYELKFTETDLAVRNYKAGIAAPEPVNRKRRPDGIRLTSGHKQRNADLTKAKAPRG